MCLLLPCIPHPNPCRSIQAKLQKAQQQREYAKAFHADVLKRLAAEEAQQQVCPGMLHRGCGCIL